MIPSPERWQYWWRPLISGWILILGLVEACGNRRDVELVLIQAEQGLAGDFNSYGRTLVLATDGCSPQRPSPPAAGRSPTSQGPSVTYDSSYLDLPAGV
jgi:hypothetical protein